jgi:hypothetical protein
MSSGGIHKYYSSMTFLIDTGERAKQCHQAEYISYLNITFQAQFEGIQVHIRDTKTFRPSTRKSLEYEFQGTF